MIPKMIIKVGKYAVIVVFGLLSIHVHCGNLDLISPIEVVEEWGCHDTEIRLTCGHIDSKIAILEATFTPNCSEDDCLQLDIKRLSRKYSSPKHVNPHTSGTEAARKFLETLRMAHVKDDDNDGATEDEGNHEESKTKVFMSSLSPHSDHYIGSKRKRTSLRASLERLIMKYLHKYSSDEEVTDVVKRYVRSYTDKLPDEQVEQIIVGERNLAVDSTEMQENEESSVEKLRKLIDMRSPCPQHKRRITALNRLTIDMALQNESNAEHNIRKELNHRCSGKNHCSFLFAVDHPLSILWDSGIVRIKYACMEDFRINHFCNEQLSIGIEVLPKPRHTQERKGEPRAEARVQSNEQAFHSLKILKSNTDFEEILQKETGKIRNAEQYGNQLNPTGGIYSQDFKLLKILPKNLDDLNDIEKIGDEIHFRKDEDILNSPLPSESTSSNQWNQKPSSNLDTVEISQNLLPLDENEDLFTNAHYNFSDYENITLIIREGEKYIITFPEPRILENIIGHNSTSYSFDSQSAINQTLFTSTIVPAYTKVKSTISSPTELSKSHFKNESDLNGLKLDNIEKINPESSVATMEVVPTVVDMSVESSENQYHDLQVDESLPKILDSNEDDFYDFDSINSYEDYSDENSDRRSYTSIQRTLFRRPLLQGFAMSPGYPKYYIGDSECQWKLTAPQGQKIRLTILDISLRYETVCKDFISVVDLGLQRMLFNSCSELIKPLEITSYSNEIEVLIKTTTKFAYPKRGVLIHYSALGCLTPPPPMNGKLVERKESSALFECDENFVFPDTSVNKRQLQCKSHIWDKTLPNCIENIYVAGIGVISGHNINSIINQKELTVSEMGDKAADIVYDIIIPCTLIAGLFIVNAIIFAIIVRYRRRNISLDGESKELAEL